MKTTKLLLSSLVLAGMFSACAHEEQFEVANPDATLAERTQVNLTLSSPAETRLGVTANGGVNFTTTDQLGAVMVDGGFEAGKWNNVNWTVSTGHVANNKWAWNGSKFVTEGTTAVGAWLFYTQYNPAFTGARTGLTYNFPQIQEASSDLTWIANNNINFHISPVLFVDGYEGSTIDVEVKYASVYNYLNLKLALPKEVTKVDKILVSATNENGAVKFASKSKVVNGELPVAKLSVDEKAPVDVRVPNHDGNQDADENDILNTADQNIEAYIAYAKLSNVDLTYDAKKGEYTKEMNWKEKSTVGSLTAPAADAKFYDYLVVDCGEHANNVAVVDGMFSTYMLMPADVYSTITLEVYTNNGVYTKTVKGVDSYKENRDPKKSTDVNPSEDGYIVLRPQAVTNLANVENFTKKGEDIEALSFLNIEDEAETLMTETNVISSTSDLVSFINSIDKNNVKAVVKVLSQKEISGNGDAAIAAHNVVINKEVMAAIEAKEAALKEEINVKFLGEVSVAGGASTDDRLSIHSMEFAEGVVIESGYVAVDDDITVPAGKTMTVKSNVVLNTNYYVLNKETKSWTISNIVVKAGASVTAAEDAIYTSIENNGTFATRGNALTVTIFENKKGAVAAFKGDVKVTTLNITESKVSNTNKLQVSNGTWNKKAEFTNNKTVSVKGELTNNGTVTNGEAAKFVVSSTGTAIFTNKGTFVNKGSIYTSEGNNTIVNLGTIEAKDGSTTYITKNSSDDELAKGTAAVTMGTIKMEKRNADISVTTPNYQGYKEFTFDGAKLEKATGDKFNKVVLTANAEVKSSAAENVTYIVANGDLTLPAETSFQEVAFKANATLYAPLKSGVACVAIANLSVAQGKLVKLPTENAILVVDVTKAASKTLATIVNNGELLVGGDLYTTLTLAQAKKSSKYNAGTEKNPIDAWGEFLSGDGQNTAFHWDFQAADANDEFGIEDLATSFRNWLKKLLGIA